MLGGEYSDIESFFEDVLYDRDDLDHEYVLDRVYSKKQIHEIVRYCKEKGILEDDINVESDKGIIARYEYVKRISEKIDESKLEKVLSFTDHFRAFQVFCYFDFSKNAECKNMEKLKNHINSELNVNIKKYKKFFDGLTNSSGRDVSLESIYFDDKENVISLLYSCTRVLKLPSANNYSLENYFVARIPILCRFLFDYSLLEINIPTFSEPVKCSDDPTTSPERYQVVVNNVLKNMNKILTKPVTILDYNKFPLHLENNYNAEDMGWKISPQEEADFDLQQNVIPLKSILNKFSESIKRELELKKIDHSIKDIDLYGLFRSIKEKSHTRTFLLSAQLGKRHGKKYILINYPYPGSDYYPVVFLPDREANIVTNLRIAISGSQYEDISNEYNIENLLNL